MGAEEVTILLRASQDLSCLGACDALTGMFGCGLRSSSSPAKVSPYVKVNVRDNFRTSRTSGLCTWIRQFEAGHSSNFPLFSIFYEIVHLLQRTSRYPAKCMKFPRWPTSPATPGFKEQLTEYYTSLQVMFFANWDIAGVFSRGSALDLPEPFLRVIPIPIVLG
jgi:hypothetical protein